MAKRKAKEGIVLPPESKDLAAPTEQEYEMKGVDFALSFLPLPVPYKKRPGKPEPKRLKGKKSLPKKR